MTQYHTKSQQRSNIKTFVKAFWGQSAKCVNPENFSCQKHEVNFTQKDGRVLEGEGLPIPNTSMYSYQGGQS